MRVVLQANPREVLVIQEEALVSSATRNFVYRVIEQSGKTIAQRVEVRLGVRRKGEVEVLAGLDEGDQVIVHGVNRLKDGQPVLIKAIETDNQTLQQMLKSTSSDKSQGA